MCGNERSAQGGTVAIIHSVLYPQHTLRLTFQNPAFPAAAPTRITCEVSDRSRGSLGEKGCVLQIQYVPFVDLVYPTSSSRKTKIRSLCKRMEDGACRTVEMALLMIRDSQSQHGDLTARDIDSSSVMHTSTMGQSGKRDEVDFGERLELDVGGRGVIGRMVSVVRGKERLGDGIIGWN